MSGNLKTAGEILQDARKLAKLSLAELAEKTKIPERSLAALELDEFHKLSGPIYVKSFLRTYAETLGLDPQEVLDLFQQQTGGGGSAKGPDPFVPVEPAFPKKIQPVKVATEPSPKPARPERDKQEDVWQEDVRVRRIGPSLGLRILFGVAILALIVAAAFLLSRLSGPDQPATSTLPARETPVLVASQNPGQISGAAVHSEPGLEPVHRSPPVGSPIRREPLGSRLARLDADTLFGFHLPSPDQQTDQQPRERLDADLGIAPSSGPVGRDISQELPARTPEPDPEPEVVRPLRLETAPVGHPALNFQGDRRYPLVLRLVFPERIEASVTSAGGYSTDIQWPASGTAAPFPQDGVVPGQPYAVREGYVVFWGAADHFYLNLGEEGEVEVTLNGREQTVTPFRRGRPWLLDRDALTEP